MMNDKKAILRRSIKASVKALSDAEKAMRASRVWASVEKDPRFASAEYVLLFWSLPDEVDTHAFVEK